MLELAEHYGTYLDPWQRDAVEIGCGVREDGRWAAQTVGINVSRQNGKSVAGVVRALAGVLLFGEHTVILSAHQQKTSRVLFQNVESYFANYPDLTKRVKSVTAALGREEIRLKSGALIAFPARTRQTLRGWSVDCYIADEAQLVTNDQWASAKPAMAARRGAQTWMLGTAPSALGDAEVFGRLRAAAIADSDPGLAWLEYGAEPGCNLDDREQWAAANPGRVDLDAVISERRELSDADFAKERLNIWPTEQAESVFGAGVWQRLASPRRGDLTTAAALGVDRSPDGLVAIVAAYRPPTGGTHVEVVYVEDNAASMAPAVEWLLAAPRRLPIVIDSLSPAATAVATLQNRHRKVVVTHTAEAVRAAMAFADDVKAGTLTHADSPNGDLAAAVAVAQRRPVGDAGGWAWDRRDSGTALSPLVAAGLARYTAAASRPRGTTPRRERRVSILD